MDERKLRWQYGQQRDSVNASPQKSKGIPTSEQSRERRVKRKDVETTVEYLPRLRPGVHTQSEFRDLCSLSRSRISEAERRLGLGGAFRPN
jgi:hypothetical protein